MTRRAMSVGPYMEEMSEQQRLSAGEGAGAAQVEMFQAGGLLRTCTPPMLNRSIKSARLYEHSP